MDNLGETTTEWIDLTKWTNIYNRAKEFFKKKWNVIKRESWQEIRITNTWIKKNIHEAYTKKNPAIKENFAAFELLPQVLKDGKLVNIAYNRKWYWADTYMYAAPVIIDDKRYICTVAVNNKIWWDDFTYYLHEVGKDIDWQ